MKKDMIIATGYKLFEVNEEGIPYTLFIDKNTPIPVGVWLPAENHPTKGFAVRPGWHVGQIPDAPWLKSYDGTDTGYYKPRWKKGARKWAKVEYNVTNDYTLTAQGQAKKCLPEVPENGYYFFYGAGDRDWIITSDIKIVRFISEEERQDILREMGYNEIEAYDRFKRTAEKKYAAFIETGLKD